MPKIKIATNKEKFSKQDYILQSLRKKGHNTRLLNNLQQQVIEFAEQQSKNKKPRQLKLEKLERLGAKIKKPEPKSLPKHLEYLRQSKKEKKKFLFEAKEAGVVLPKKSLNGTRFNRKI
eukprot:TRINITY_DN2191_c0_g4_i2.p1 TRINITY_DN2191_c0_g4~~TRINITY_DN2191_c0_g4_i2.p1  ORF type:complete len:119 (-),score=34.19 TRINITY_DN2191_c0_g4_i2:125-481(-)